MVDLKNGVCFQMIIFLKHVQKNSPKGTLFHVVYMLLPSHVWIQADISD